MISRCIAPIYDPWPRSSEVRSLIMPSPFRLGHYQTTNFLCPQSWVVYWCNTPTNHDLYITHMLYNDTRILCVCVCPTWGIRNWRSYCHAFYTILKSFAWQVEQTAFQAYTAHGLRKKPSEVFLQLHAEFHTWTVTFPVTLGRKNLAHYSKAFGAFLKGMHWWTHPPHHGWHSCYCFLREWATDTSQYEKLITQ